MFLLLVKSNSGINLFCETFDTQTGVDNTIDNFTETYQQIEIYNLKKTKCYITSENRYQEYENFDGEIIPT